MPFLTKSDLITHVYPEIIDVITRTEDSIVDKAISAGIDEAKVYLNRFDMVAIFGTDVTAPTYTNGYLNTLVKDLVCWHLIKLSNPNINLELFRAAYTDAQKMLEKAANGKIDTGWPLRTDAITLSGELPGPNIGGENINNGLDPSGHISWNSNRRRGNHW